MNEFKNSLVVSRENSGEIIITESLKSILIELMKGNISKNEVMNLTGIGDKKTVELKIQKMVSKDPKLEMLYEEYMSSKNTDFSGYNFRPEAIEMLRKDYSQSFMAQKIGVSRRSFSTKMKKLSKQNEDNILGRLLLVHADKQMKRQKCSEIELLKRNIQLNEYENDFPIGVARYEKRSAIQVRRDNVLNIVECIDKLLEDGKTLKQLSQEGIISESNYRKYKQESINLSKILKIESKEEK